MDEACTIIKELMSLVGIGDKGWTDAEDARLELVAARARAYLAQHTSEDDFNHD